MDYIFIIIIVISWILMFLTNNKSGLIQVLLLFMIIYTNGSHQSTVDLLIKSLFLITVLYLLITSGFKSKVLFILILVMLFSMSLSYFFGIRDGYYTLQDAVTAGTSILLGFMIMCINLKDKTVVLWLKTVSLMPVISLIIGIPLFMIGAINYLGRDGTSIAGSSLSTNLSFFGVLGIMAVTILSSKYDFQKYNVLKFINFFIVLSTLTRGGIISSLVLLIPDVIIFFKKILQDATSFLKSIFFGLISVFPIILIVQKLLTRSYESNGTLNTSGRSDAWKIILSLQTNYISGNGIGSLKTYTFDQQLAAFTAAHNEYVRIFFETGWIGVGCSLIALFLIIKNIEFNKMDFFILLSFLIYSFTDNTIMN
ncbi:O-antigen ligase family protein, partial [Oenococcus oeni]|uniref:O-antigen ligase family protein n=2 Tax=Oenococcus oeni TaxID=1247 RepID=UPI0008F7F0B4